MVDPESTQVIQGRNIKPADVDEPSPPRRWPWIFAFFLLLFASGAGAWFGFMAWQEGRLQIAKLEAKHETLLEQLMKQRPEQEALQARLKELEAENAALKGDVQLKDEELARLKGTFDELQDKMKAEIAKGEISLSQAEGKLRVDLVDKILFDSGEAQISKRGEEVLTRVGAVLASIDDKNIQVSGHTDDAPISKALAEKFPTNWELSAARALNVVRFLQDTAKVPGKRLVASGFGPFQPIASNGTAAGRARNRRIEILLTPALKVAKADLAEIKDAAEAKPAPKPAKGK